MLVIPIAFLTEHIETLHEINIEAREQAESLGINDFHMMPALNDSPLLIRALADLRFAPWAGAPAWRRSLCNDFCRPALSVFVHRFHCDFHCVNHALHA